MFNVYSLWRIFYAIDCNQSNYWQNIFEYNTKSILSFFYDQPETSMSKWSLYILFYDIECNDVIIVFLMVTLKWEKEFFNTMIEWMVSLRKWRQL